MILRLPISFFVRNFECNFRLIANTLFNVSGALALIISVNP